MGWMSLPATSYDYYVDGTNGSDTNGGTSWSDAFATISHAASTVGSYARVWIAPGDYTFTSTVSYTDKRIQWIAPPPAGGRDSSSTGSVQFTGSTNAVSSFINAKTSEGHNVFGGGFHNITFDADAISAGGSALYLQQINYPRVEGCNIIAPASSFKHVYMLRMDELPTSSTIDKSWLTARHLSSYNCGLIYGPSSGGGFNGWWIEDVRCDADTAATYPYILLEDKTQGIHISGGYFNNTDSNVAAVKIDQTGITQSRTVNITGLAFDNLSSPYYGVALYNCQVFIGFGGGAADANGLIYGDSSCTGFVAAPSSAITGSLTAGEN